MKRKYQNSKSFFRKTQIALVLLGLLPYLLVIYLFFYGGLSFTDTVVLFSALVLVSILAGFSLLRQSADNLAKLATETGAIEAGQENKVIQIKADEEINDIAKHFNSLFGRFQGINRELAAQSVQLMAYARDLSRSYQKTKEEERLRNKLGRYVSENLIEKLIGSRDGVLMENERKEVTVLYADIRAFTTLSEKMPAEDVVSMLNQFFSAMVDIIFKHNGVLDKFVGDQLMAVFGLISPDGNVPHRAIDAALEMQTITEDLMKKRAIQKKETFEIGIGINTGTAILGNVGSENRMDYTVIGDCVNMAAKFQQIAKGGEIMIGEETFRQTKGHYKIDKKIKLKVKNKSESVIGYKVAR
jgi:class 3 adenylate cyclase